MRQHGRVRPALQRGAELGHVVAVVVGEQDVRDGQPVLVRLGEQAVHRPAGVDEEGVGVRTGGHEIGVGQPPVRHGALDDHGPDGTLGRVMELIHTCYRIGDIDRSVAFYEALGFEERRRAPIRDEAINVFMGLPGDGDRLELTYNFGVDSYELGTGYNHIALTVDDLDGTLANLAEKGIEPEKPPYRIREGGNRLCFVRDPDGYRVELIETA
jgi:lactoylglutathione lyase